MFCYTPIKEARGSNFSACDPQNNGDSHGDPAHCAQANTATQHNTKEQQPSYNITLK